MSTAEAIKELMDAWNKVEAAAKSQFPLASAEEIYQITKSVIDGKLGVGK